MNSRGLAGAGAAHDTAENLPLALATVTAVGSFAVKVAAVALDARVGGDWTLHALLADNILAGCGVSVSRPPSEACAPDFGGSQYPAFPAFIAAIWALAGDTVHAVLLVQSAILALAAGYGVYWVARASSSPWLALFAALLIGLSPTQTFYARFGLAEALVLAATLVLATELLRSLLDGRLRVATIGLALAAAVCLRLDSIFLLAAVAVVGFALHAPLEALRRGAIVVVIVLLPVAGWTLRNVALELPRAAPSPWVMPDGRDGPLGYLAWLQTWVVTGQQRGQAMWFRGTEFDRIRIDKTAAYAGAEEQNRVEDLMGRLLARAGDPFPPDIDRAFAEIAAEKRAKQAWHARLALLAKRCWWLWREWFTPFRYYGPSNIVAKLREEPVRVALSLSASLERSMLVVLFAAAAAALFLRAARAAAPLIWATLALIVVKTPFLAALMLIEIRYTVALVPMMAMAALSVALSALGPGKATPPPLR
ncbi:MAG: glycosyltransferase family 39 protein [Kiloniellales bacterium]|nr:glycosyltransferase family 39 protein [Kiloniellales bacterium]